MRIAALADVHGNLPALRAAWRDIEAAEPDLVVSCGDLTWGSLPRETIDFVRGRELPLRFVRGNAERALLEQTDDRERARWMYGQHTADDLDWLRSFEPTVSVGGIRFCHGSPQHDEDIITPITPPARLGPLLEGVSERTVVSAHIHVQFDRTVDGIRSINPGSIGLPYEGRSGGAYWALIDGDAVALRRTEYDVEETCALFAATDDPMREAIVQELRSPTTREEMVPRAEQLERSG